MNHSPPEMGAIGPPWFDDAPVAIVAGGKSLVGFDFERLRGVHVIAVKGSIFDIPWSDCGIGIDYPRLCEWVSAGKFENVTMPVYWTMTAGMWKNLKITAKPKCMTFLTERSEHSLSMVPTEIARFGSSGLTALNLATLKRGGIKYPIYLFGFDYNVKADQKKIHHNEQHYKHARPQPVDMWLNWARAYSAIAGQLINVLHAKVINVNPESGITCFPKVSIEQALDSLHRFRSETGSGLCRGWIERTAQPHDSSSDPGAGAR